jgi:hypothetical protein
MATSSNRNNSKLGTPTTLSKGAAEDVSRTNTAKQNYTAKALGNDHGSISFGSIHKQGEVTADVMLRASDGRHSIILDKEGKRKGCTQITAPGRITIDAGEDKTEAADTLMIHSWNGNICIVASNGKLRLQGTDIELVAVGEGGSKGNIRIKASETIELDGKKVIGTAKTLLKMASSGQVEMAANTAMNIYGSLIRNTTDAVANKEGKNGGGKLQNENNQVQ